MALIDSNNFITHLVWRGLIDKATCGELKEAIELCTVKDTYSKADVVALLEEVALKFQELTNKYDMEILYEKANEFEADFNSFINEKIDALKGETNASTR